MVWWFCGGIGSVVGWFGVSVEGGWCFNVSFVTMVREIEKRRGKRDEKFFILFIFVVYIILLDCM